MSRRPTSRYKKVLAFAAACGIFAATSPLWESKGAANPFSLPSKGVPAFRVAIVRNALSQVGYSTSPSNTYCNKFSAFWGAGNDSCGNGNLSEEWCADFAAWAWRKGGATFDYGGADGEINGAAASFYLWGVRQGTWHPISSGYVPQPGDVAVYGLDAPAASADHVALVVSVQSGESGPNVVNGDGNRTGFSVVETAVDQYASDAQGAGGSLSGYVSPISG